MKTSFAGQRFASTTSLVGNSYTYVASRSFLSAVASDTSSAHIISLASRSSRRRLDADGCKSSLEFNSDCGGFLSSPGELAGSEISCRNYGRFRGPEDELPGG